MQNYVDAVLKIQIMHCGEVTNAPKIVPYTSRSVLTTGEHKVKEGTLAKNQSLATE